MITAQDWIRSRLQAKQSDSNPHQYWANCPFTEKHAGKPDSRRRMGILLKGRNGGVCHCFRCEYQGSVQQLISDVDGIHRSQLRNHILFTGTLTFPSVREARRVKKMDLPAGYSPLNSKTISHRMAVQYLQERGVGWDAISSYELGWCVEGDFARRIIFPIRFNGEIVGYQGRVIDDQKPKYRFPPGAMINHCLYNWDRVREQDSVILVEGVMDALVLPERCVAIFGKQISPAQKKLIVKTWKQVFVGLDEEEYDLASDTICGALEPFLDVKKLPIPGDPNEAGKEVILNSLLSAESKSVFSLDKIK